MSTTITNALPDIPRLYTGICEWLACVVYLLVIYRRVPLRRTIAVGLIGLPAMIAIQYFDGVMPIWFWVIGMLLAFAGMWAIILFGAGTGKREGMYIAARAFVLAELVASLHWQLVMFLNLGENPERAQLFSLLLLAVTYAVCFTVAWLIERGNFANDAPTVATAQLAIGTGAITIVTFAMSNLSFVSTNTPFSGTVGQEVFYIRTLVDFCGFAILYAQQEQARRMEASAELTSINAQLESQHQEYLASKENIESIGRLAHDLKHQIAALRAEVDPEHAAAGFGGASQRPAAFRQSGAGRDSDHQNAHVRGSRHHADRRGGRQAAGGHVVDGYRLAVRQRAGQRDRGDQQTARPAAAADSARAVRAGAVHGDSRGKLLRFRAQEGFDRRAAHHQA